MKTIISVILFALLSVGCAFANPEILCIQNFLKKTAFDPGIVDGKWGSNTEIAVNSLFEQVGLTKKDHKITSEQVKEVCEILKGSRSSEILELGQFKIYDVEVK
jgi:hypothetical protein